MCSMFRCEPQVPLSELFLNNLYSLKDRKKTETPINNEHSLKVRNKGESQVLNLDGIIMVSRAHNMSKSGLDPIDCKSSYP